MKENNNSQSGAPSGYRRLEVGEMVLASDFGRAKSNPEDNLLQCSGVGIRVTANDWAWFYRPIKAGNASGLDGSLPASDQTPKMLSSISSDGLIALHRLCRSPAPILPDAEVQLGVPFLVEKHEHGPDPMSDSPLDQIRRCGFRDAQGHPLENNEGFRALVAGQTVRDSLTVASLPKAPEGPMDANAVVDGLLAAQYAKERDSTPIGPICSLCSLPVVPEVEGSAPGKVEAMLNGDPRPLLAEISNLSAELTALRAANGAMRDALESAFEWGSKIMLMRPEWVELARAVLSTPAPEVMK